MPLLNCVIILEIYLGSRFTAFADNKGAYTIAISIAVAQHDVHTVTRKYKIVCPKHDNLYITTRFSPNDYDIKAVSSKQNLKPKVSE